MAAAQASILINKTVKRENRFTCFWFFTFNWKFSSDYKHSYCIDLRSLEDNKCQKKNVPGAQPLPLVMHNRCWWFMPGLVLPSPSSGFVKSGMDLMGFYPDVAGMLVMSSIKSFHLSWGRISLHRAWEHQGKPGAASSFEPLGHQTNARMGHKISSDPTKRF